MLRHAARFALRTHGVAARGVAQTPLNRPGSALWYRALSAKPAGAGAGGMGFSYPGPRKLADITKLQLLDKHTASGVSHIWTEFHADHKSAIADVLSADAYRQLSLRAQRCPLFVLPVPRDGGFFSLLAQIQGRQIMMTFLEDYKRNAAAAMPYLTVTIFEEMVTTKGIALVRAEVTDMVSREEARTLWNLLKRFYLGEGRDGYDAVVKFNEKPAEFDFNQVLRIAGVGAKA